jgi:hypothetical protein
MLDHVRSCSIVELLGLMPNCRTLVVTARPGPLAPARVENPWANSSKRPWLPVGGVWISGDPP